jgi:hypothetical protein
VWVDVGICVYLSLCTVLLGALVQAQINAAEAAVMFCGIECHLAVLQPPRSN